MGVCDIQKAVYETNLYDIISKEDSKLLEDKIGTCLRKLRYFSFETEEERDMIFELIRERIELKNEDDELYMAYLELESLTKDCFDPIFKIYKSPTEIVLVKHFIANIRTLHLFNLALKEKYFEVHLKYRKILEERDFYKKLYDDFGEHYASQRKLVSDFLKRKDLVSDYIPKKSYFGNFRDIFLTF